jgi:hypothetical protein
MVIQTPIQKAQAVLGILIGWVFIGWITKYSLTKKLMLLRAGEDNLSEYHGYLWAAIVFVTMFFIGGILLICYFIWPEWFDRFEKK